MDENTIFDKVHDVDLKQTMENSYIDYAMSVIAARALPDVRDGLKPVQRRILYAMIELNNGPDKPHRKCARIVGDAMGKYHPNGDSSIYGALVNMAQEWSTRYPLVDGHGNFGSVDGDGAAAMRYTEARLSKISMELLADIGKDTVNFIPNFDETEKEPQVLPSRFPNLLVNGTQGIAVGMATNIPPHNLTEVINAVVKIIDDQVERNQVTDIEELLDIVKGPDFPTGTTILGKAGISQAYRTGRGKIKVRAVTDIEPMANGKQRIVVTELPYMVNKARLIQKIAELVKDKKVDGITEIRDESDRTGMRICIELRRDANANVVLNRLFKHTQMQDTFGVIMLSLVNNEPKILNLFDMLNYYLEHQKDVVTRRTKYELNKAEERAHILEGLLIAQDNIDEVIKIIRAAANITEAKTQLMERFALTDAQAQALLDSSSPLDDVYHYFEKLETGYMDVIRDSIENRADDVCRAKEELRTTPVYPHSAAYAREHGELEQYRASNNANLQCKESIEAAVREHFDGMYLSHDAAKGVIETYGMERVAMVLANTVQLQDWDGRYSRRNKEWAKTIPNDNPETVRCGYALNSHPAVLDGFIDLVRVEQQRSRTQGEKLQPSRPSVRDKLKQELPAHKPAAPKKREPER